MSPFWLQRFWLAPGLFKIIFLLPLLPVLPAMAAEGALSSGAPASSPAPITPKFTLAPSPASSATQSRRASRAPAQERLTLSQAIARALANNQQYVVLKKNFEIASLSYDQAWDTMFLPGASITAASTSNFGVGAVPTAKGREAVGANPRANGYPNSGVTFNFGTYTLFNFWRDWNTYEGARIQFQRAGEQFAESVRSFRFRVISAYFTYVSARDKYDAAARSIEMAQALLELVRSRKRIGKGSDSDISSSEFDVITAVNDRNQQETYMRSALWTLNQLLGDPMNTPYTIADAIKFESVHISPEQAFKMYQETSPSARNAKVEIEQADLRVELEQKNRLPLPKFTFSGVNVNYGNNYYGGTNDVYGQAAGNYQLEVSGAISLTLPILGPDGFFNSRRVAQAQVNRELAEARNRDTATQNQAQIYGLLQQIQQDEEAIKNNEKAFSTASQLLDQVLERLSKTEINRLELRDAVQQARQSQLNLADSIIGHLNNKLRLAELIGVDRLPGDNFP